MSDLIKSWVLRILGVVLEPDAWNSDSHGVILGRILERYSLIDEDQLNALEGGPAERNQTLESMRVAINGIGVDLTKSDFQDYLAGRGTMATKLYYELYLTLHDKNRVYFIASRKAKDNVVKSVEGRFVATEVRDLDDPVDKLDNPLAETRMKQEHVVEWYRNKMASLMEKCRESREAYLDYVRWREVEEAHEGKVMLGRGGCEEAVEKLCPEFREENLTYDELLVEERVAQSMSPVKGDPEAAKGILEEIKKRRQKVRQRTERREVYHKKHTKDIWDKVLKDQADHYKETFTEKLLRQSLYERQMAVKLREIRREEEIMAQNRQDMMTKVAQAKEREIVGQFMRSSKEQDAQKVRYYIEKERNMELHRRLYGERLRLKEEQNLRLCRDAVDDIVDIAVLLSEYQQRYGEDVGARKYNDLGCLFVKQLPIFDILEHVEDFMFDESSTVEDEETQKMYQIEVARQSFLDEITLEEYLQFLRPKKIQMPPDQRYTITTGMNCLGFIAHRLLLLKYPKKSLPPPPDIPRPSVAACVTGLHNMAYRVPLEKLLQARKVKVITMQDAINYCTQTFKEETTGEYLEKALVEETKEGLGKLHGTKKKGHNKGPKSISMVFKKEDSVKAFEDKEVQTPRRFPCEEVNLSEAGELGRIAHQVLNLGDVLDDRLMSDMFAQYLKSLKGWDGWVLLNYPQTMQQAVALEQRLTGVEVPIVVGRRSVESFLEDSDFDREIPENGTTFDQLEAKRHSKIVPNPQPIEVLSYNTYLTAFVSLESYEGDDLEEQYSKFFIGADEVEQVRSFYAEQGCCATLRYKTVDFPTVKQLAKTVIGDLSGKTSVELFADTVRYVQAEWDNLVEPRFEVVKQRSSKRDKAGSKRPSNEASTEMLSKNTGLSSSKARKSRSSKATATRKSTDRRKSTEVRKSTDRRNSKTFEDKETQVPSVTALPPGSVDDFKVEPKPGEENWDYLKLPIPPNLAEALATIWETMEDVYTTSLKQMFFRTRIILDGIVPYISYVHANMEELIDRPHDMQRQLRDFQTEFNAFDDDMRDDEDFKAEMHARIRDFRERLWTVCDERKKENVNEHRQLMSKNWLINNSYELAFNVIEPLQLEIDRCYDSVRIVVDYYTSMVTKAPFSERTPDRVVLPTLPMPNEDDAEARFGVTFSGESFNDSFYARTIDADMKRVQTAVADYAQFGQAALEALHEVFEPQPKSPKLKVQVLEPDQEVKEEMEALFEEFQCVLDGIITRTEVICEVIRYWYNVKQGELMSRTNRFFHNVHNSIRERYEKECETVEAICSLFLRAVEAETKVKPEIVITGSSFHVDLESLMYEEDFEDPTLPAEDPGEETYLMHQLERTVNVLQGVAPTAVMPERTFTFLLQDFMVRDKVEDGKCLLVPRLWTQLHPSKTHLLTRRLFGDAAYVDWRDFILYNLGVRFPTGEEVLRVRRALLQLDPDRTECLQLHQYPELVYWFEDELPKETLKEVRNLLLRMFTVDGDRFNYSAMLLAFCKGDEAVSGLAKAVGLSVGKLLCYDAERSKMADEAATSEEATTDDDAATEWPEEELPEEPQLKLDEVLQYLRRTNLETAEEDRRSFFTNCSQSGDTRTAVDYYVSFEVLINVLAVTLPWLSKMHSPTPEGFREKVASCFRANCAPEWNRCCAYQLFNDPEFRELMGGVYRFVVKDPLEIVREILRRSDVTLHGSDGCQKTFA